MRQEVTRELCWAAVCRLIVIGFCGVRERSAAGCGNRKKRPWVTILWLQAGVKKLQ